MQFSIQPSLSPRPKPTPARIVSSIPKRSTLVLVWVWAKTIYNPIFHIIHERYIRGCILNRYMPSPLPWFVSFCCSAIPTSLYILNVFYTCSPHFCSCILTPHKVHNFEFKVQTCCLCMRTNKLCLRWSHTYWVGGFKRLVRLRGCQKAMGLCTAQCKIFVAAYLIAFTPQTTQFWLQSSVALRMCTYEENDVAHEAIVIEWAVSSVSWDLEVVKKRWGRALLSVKILSWRFFTTLGVFLARKTLKDELQVVIKAYLLPVFEISRRFCPLYPYI